MLLRRDQLGLRKSKKDANRDAKAKDTSEGSGKRKSEASCKTAKKPKASSSKGAGDDEDDWTVWYGDYEAAEAGWEDWEWEQWEWGLEQDESGRVVPTGKTSKGKGGRTKAAAELKSDDDKTPATTKPKAKGKAKATPKAKATSKGTSKPDSKKGKSKKEPKKSSTNVDEKDIDRLLEWVDIIDMEADPQDFKAALQGRMPVLDGSVRLNRYWNRPGCGVTLRCVNEDNEKKQKDVGYFTFGKGNAGLLFSMISGLYMAT